MKTLHFIGALGMLIITTGIYASEPLAGREIQKLEMARNGCQKPIGYFPTPSKIMCILTAFGLSEKNVKAKSLALIFNVCKGRLLEKPTPGVTPKSYASLGTCLSDPTAIALINKELKTQGFPEIKVVNSAVIGTP